MRTSFSIPDARVAFDCRHHEVIRELRAVQREHQDVVLNTSHTHQGEWCLEPLFCRGSAERVRELSYRLRDFDGVRRMKVMVARDGVDWRRARWLHAVRLAAAAVDTVLPLLALFDLVQVAQIHNTSSQK